MADHSAAMNAKNAGNAFFKKKQFAEAIAEYSKGIDIDPTWEVLYSNRSQAYFYLKKYDEALADGTLCIKVKPDYAKGYHRAANALVRKNMWVEALDVLERAYKKGFRSHKDLSKLDEKVRENAEIVKARALKNMPKLEKWKAEGNKHFKNGDYENALKLYQKVIDKGDVNKDRALFISCYCNRAICYQQQSSFDLVVAECCKCLELDPTNAKALLRRSSAFEGMEKYRLALDDARKVLLRHPKNKVANKAQHRLSSAVRRLKAAKSGQY